MSGCQDCPQRWFMAHLGRCRACLYKSLGLTLMLLLALMAERLLGLPWRHLYVLATLIFCLLFGALTLAHLGAALWYRRFPSEEP